MALIPAHRVDGELEIDGQDNPVEVRRFHGPVALESDGVALC